MGATATQVFLRGSAADAFRQDYLWQTKALIHNTVVTLKSMKLRKSSTLPGATATADTAGRPCAGGVRWKGQWVPVARDARACPAGVCSGNPSKVLQLNSSTNSGMGFSHVYAPWQCRPYTLYDGPACLAGKRLVFIGNSRTYQLMEFVKAHLGVEKIHRTPTMGAAGLGGAAAATHSPGSMGGSGSSSSGSSSSASGGSQSHGHNDHVDHQYSDGDGPNGARPGQAASSLEEETSGLFNRNVRRQHALGGSVGSGSGGSMGSGGGGGSGGSSGTSIQFIEILPFRTGLRAVLASVNLTRLLLHNDFVFINSILHDIVNYKDQASAAAAQNLGRWSYGTGPGTLGTTACAPTNASEVFRQKYRPVHQFEEAIRGFADELRDARAAIKAAAAAQRRRAASNPAGARPGPSPTDTTAIHMARVVWLMHGYRPGPLPNACFPNTPERMLCLQHLVVRELERVGVELVDLATIEMDSPAQWFYDAVHIAGAGGIQRWGSGLELMAVQVLLNSVCGPNAAEAEGARGRAARGKGAHE